MPITYSTFEVTDTEYRHHSIGDTYNGGEVVEGTCDTDRNVLLLVVRYGYVEEEE